MDLSRWRRRKKPLAENIGRGRPPGYIRPRRPELGAEAIRLAKTGFRVRSPMSCRVSRSAVAFSV